MLTFEGQITLNTARAIRFQGNYWEASIWLPKSQIEIIEDPDASFEVVVKAKPWIAKVKDIHEFTPYSEEDINQRNEK